MANTNPDDSSKPVVQGAALLDQNQLELFKEFLKLQADEISLKRQQFEIDLQQHKDSHEIAKLSIDAQLRDRQSERVFKSKYSTKTYIFVGALVILFLCFGGYALYLGKEGVVKQIVETVVIAIGGVASGYAYCLKKTVGKNAKLPTDENED